MDPHTAIFGEVTLRGNTTRHWQARQREKGLTQAQAKWLYSQWQEFQLSTPASMKIFDGWGNDRPLREAWQTEQENANAGYGDMLKKFWGLMICMSRNLRNSHWIPDSVRERLAIILDDEHTYELDVIEATSLANEQGQAKEWPGASLLNLQFQGVLDTRSGIIR